MADISNKIPPYGLIHDWLGRKTVDRLLRFAQSNEPRFEDTTVALKQGQAVDRTRFEDYVASATADGPLVAESDGEK